MEQRTQEWLDARIGRITGSRIAAVLGHSPWQTRKALLAEMVNEAMGKRVSRDSVAMTWGRDHEDEALEDFIQKAGGEDPSIEPGGWYTRGDELGYSPDALADAFLVEIKCPFSQLLPDDVPVHYEDQCQLGMLVTERDECALHFWTPTRSETFWLSRDESWAERAIPQVADFMASYRAALLDPTAWGIVERTDAAWIEASRRYVYYLSRQKDYEALVSEAKAHLESLSGQLPAEGGGVKLEYVTRNGAVDWKRLAKKLEISQELQDAYRGKSTRYARVTVAGEDE